MPPALMGRFLMADSSRVISNARKNPGLHIPGFVLDHIQAASRADIVYDSYSLAASMIASAKDGCG